MKKLRKRFKRPKRPYDTEQLKEGKELKKSYGLRRKKEIWIAEEMVRGFRQRARKLISVSDKEKEEILLKKLAKLGLLPKGSSLDDVLGLTVSNLLERRLETIVFKAGMAKTTKQARQSIVHGFVRVKGRKTVFPSYIVTVEEESAIKSSFKQPKPPTRRGVAAAPEQADEGGEE
ncbi:MAG: 30S ribosomal protein S4 [Candidatus Aenigmarchaeota archaeon]|nr:30S ribosomal protein S4 [Candidatus Aenigmarchaeota archaeon]